MAEGDMRDRIEEYEETVDPDNPPRATAQPAAAVAGMWYYLAPIILILLVIGLALLYWPDRERGSREPVEPTTGVVDEVTPGGGNPDRTPDNTQEERDFRGGDRR